jgi:hypothetical protein
MKRDRYQQPPHDPSPEEVNFDLLPERVPDEDFFEWMRETADKCRTK